MVEDKIAQAAWVPAGRRLTKRCAVPSPHLLSASIRDRPRCIEMIGPDVTDTIGDGRRTRNGDRSGPEPHHLLNRCPARINVFTEHVTRIVVDPHPPSIGHTIPLRYAF